jgi:hypothetical protein
VAGPVAGLLLVAYATFTTVKHLAVTYLPSWSHVWDPGLPGALAATAVFGLGSYLVPTGPFRGIDSAGERAGPDGPLRRTPVPATAPSATRRCAGRHVDIGRRAQQGSMVDVPVASDRSAGWW